MNVLAIYAINEHLANLMAEADAERMVRKSKPRSTGIRQFVASLFAPRGTARPAHAAS